MKRMKRMEVVTEGVEEEKIKLQFEKSSTEGGRKEGQGGRCRTRPWGIHGAAVAIAMGNASVPVSG